MRDIGGHTMNELFGDCVALTAELCPVGSDDGVGTIV